jgi:hypothetical protein
LINHFFAYSFKKIPLIWNAGLWLWIILFLMIVLTFKQKNKISFLIILPAIAHAIILFLTNSHQSFRYMYGSVLVAMFFIPFLISLIINNKKT